jgi:hypothetical protein
MSGGGTDNRGDDESDDQSRGPDEAAKAVVSTKPSDRPD